MSTAQYKEAAWRLSVFNAYALIHRRQTELMLAGHYGHLPWSARWEKCRAKAMYDLFEELVFQTPA